jgi:ribosomal protein S18 acetylase RimI-like enzyme
MKIIEVLEPQHWKLFHQVPHRVYAKDSNWIAPLEADVQSTFTPGKNRTYEHGEAVVYVLLDDNNKPAGRIAVFIDHRNNQIQPYVMGGVGYFECLDNSVYAKALFDQADEYFRAKGVQAIDGPINFGGRDKYWGLLADGYDQVPLFHETYNPPYYNRLFEENGYIAWEQILTMKGNTATIDLGRLRLIVERIRANNDVRVETYDPKKIEQYALDFTELYNAAFGHYEHFRPADPVGFKKTLAEVKNILDPDLLGIAYVEGHPAGFVAFFPEINPFLKFAKGKLPWWKALWFVFKLKTTKSKGAKGTGFGVHPAYKTKGIFAFMVDYMTTDSLKSRYPEIFLTTVRAHNKEAVSVYLKLGVHIDRYHIGYRKSLDPKVPVEPNEFYKAD